MAKGKKSPSKAKADTSKRDLEPAKQTQKGNEGEDPSLSPMEKGKHKPCAEVGLLDEPTETSYTTAMRYVYNNLTDKGKEIPSAFGNRRMTYADYVASGRSLTFVESYINKYVSGYYGNTHTSTSYASIQTSRLRDDAKDIIRKCCNASTDDAVIFCGSGSTAAIHKLIAVLGFYEKKQARKALVLIGPYEHHSNILPWKETGAEIIRISEGLHGEFGVEQLAPVLAKYNKKEWRVLGTFSACSNVTGILVDTNPISKLMHEHNAMVFWDYAAGAPYLKIDMNPADEPLAYKDGVFCSPHKFVGGPGTPGLLIAKKKVFTNTVPHAQGGGTVLYVTHTKHVYHEDVEAREEGGTPAIVESIRAGLVFQLKEAIGCDNIHKREEHLAQKGLEALSKNENIILLGSKVLPRVPIFSFCVKHQSSKKLVHHNFIALLLNDLFGIQARGGCACAGPYAQDLLGIAEELADGIMAFLSKDVRRSATVGNADGSGTGIPMDKAIKEAESLGIMKPGFIRFNLAYFIPDEEVDFILAAVNMVANEGWKLLPQYTDDEVSGSFSHRNNVKANIMSLNDICYNNIGRNQTIHGFVNPSVDTSSQQTYTYILEAAQEIFNNAGEVGEELFPEDEITIKDLLPESLIPLVWFLDTRHALHLLRHQSDSRTTIDSLLFIPRVKSGPGRDMRVVGKQMDRYSQIRLAPLGKSQIEVKRSSCCSVM